MDHATLEEFAGFELNRPVLSFQELFTTIERIRGGRGYVQSLEVFRSMALELLHQGEEDMRKRGYSVTQINDYAAFALIAFLDESVLSSNYNALRGYASSPIGAQRYGAHNAGKIFFERVDILLRAEDSSQIADLLEIYQLCLLLGYRGKYGPGQEGELHAYADRAAAKLLRIRGSSSILAPFALPPNDPVEHERDNLGQRLLLVAVSILGVAIVLFIIYRINLGLSVDQLSSVLLEGLLRGA